MENNVAIRLLDLRKTFGHRKKQVKAVRGINLEVAANQVYGFSVQLTPVEDDELEQTANILENFAEHWQRLEGDEDGRHELVKLIVDRVYVEDETVVAMTLKSNYHLVLGHNAKEPTSHEVDPYTVQVRERRAWIPLQAQVCRFANEHKPPYFCPVFASTLWVYGI